MMNKLVFDYYKKSKFIYCGNIEIPQKTQCEIIRNWNVLKADNNFFNGDVFTVNNIKLDNNFNLNFYVYKTNYAHYLYSKNNKSVEYICRSLAANVLPITSDNFFVFGKMSQWTSLSNKIKFIGGSLNNEDIEESYISPLKCARREMLEELGIDMFNKKHVNQFKPVLIITRKNLTFFNILYSVKLNITMLQVKDLFNKHNLKQKALNINTELDSIELVENKVENMVKYLKNNKNNVIDYMRDTVNVYYGIEERSNLIDVIKNSHYFENNCSSLLR